jgi:small subunit ribosomal protein S4
MKEKKKNCYYKFYDQRSYNISRFLNRFNNSFKHNLFLKRRFKLLYGKLGVSYIKNTIKRSFLESKSGLKIPQRNHFICSLESRVDIMLLKSCFAVNIRSARQLISHGNVKVNGKVVKSNSLLLKCGDKITINQAAYPLIEYRLANNKMWVLPPKYLQVNYKIFQILVLFDPIKTNLSNNFNNKLSFDNIFHLYKI